MALVAPQRDIAAMKREAENAWASERNIGSAAGRTPFSFGPRLSSIALRRTSR